MRCMECGEQMALVAAVPDETATVAGFENETLHCPACGATERRLVFSRTPREPTWRPVPVPESVEPSGPESAPSNSSCVEPASAEPPSVPATAASVTPASAWTRAVEKLRNRQADLNERAGEAREMNWRMRFDRAWEKLGPPRPDSGRPDTNSDRPRNAPWTSSRVLRARLRKLSGAAGRGTAGQGAIASTPESMQEFNQLWDSLASGYGGPRRFPDEPAAATRPAPLPRALSLVAVEPASNSAARVILLLRGAKQLSA
jgi:hypothetical protein